MKSASILPFIVVAISAHGQMRCADDTGDTEPVNLHIAYKSVVSSIQCLQKVQAMNTFNASYLKKPMFDELKYQATSSEQYICAVEEPEFMRRATIAGNIAPIVSPMAIEAFYNIYTTSCTIGKMKFSCDYFYDDEGTLILAESCWQWGRE